MRTMNAGALEVNLPLLDDEPNRFWECFEWKLESRFYPCGEFDPQGGARSISPLSRGGHHLVRSRQCLKIVEC